MTSVFIWFAGTNFVLPFIPLYVQELGNFGLAETAVWSGVVLAATPLISGSVAPLWGILADRFGRKLLLQRSLLGFTVCLALMGVAQEPWHLLAIRAAMGLFGGFSAAAAALVSTTSPSEHLTAGIGRVQSARVLGLALGPLPGGILADTIGLRPACFVSVGAGVIAFSIVTAMAAEESTTRTGDLDGSERTSLRGLLARGPFLAALGTVLTLRLAERTFDPVLPLLISQLHPGATGVATMTAVVTSAGLLATSASAALTDGVVKGRDHDVAIRRVLVLAAVCFAPLLFAHSWWQLLVLRVMVGLALGIAVTLAFSTTANEVPVQRRGLALGTLGAGQSYGSFSGFLLAGLLSPISLPLVFGVDVVLLLVATGLHKLGRTGRPRPSTG